MRADSTPTLILPTPATSRTAIRKDSMGNRTGNNSSRTERTTMETQTAAATSTDSTRIPSVRWEFQAKEFSVSMWILPLQIWSQELNISRLLPEAWRSRWLKQSFRSSSTISQTTTLKSATSKPWTEMTKWYLRSMQWSLRSRHTKLLISHPTSQDSHHTILTNSNRDHITATTTSQDMRTTTTLREKTSKVEDPKAADSSMSNSGLWNLCHQGRVTTLEFTLITLTDLETSLTEAERTLSTQVSPRDSKMTLICKPQLLNHLTSKMTLTTNPWDSNPETETQQLIILPRDPTTTREGSEEDSKAETITMRSPLSNKATLRLMPFLTDYDSTAHHPSVIIIIP